MTTNLYADFDPEVRQLIERLIAEGFDIVEGKGRRITTGVRTSRRVMWKGEHVGRVDWRVGVGKTRGLLTYRFGAESRETSAHCPIPVLGSDTLKDDAWAMGESYRMRFAEEVGCDPDEFSVWPEFENGKWHWYLRIRELDTAIRLMRASAALIDQHDRGDEERCEASDLQKDIADIETRVSDASIRKALVDARLGQGKFRQALIRSFGGRCAVSGLGIEAALIASHIVAWKDPTTSDAERLDPQNGLLLAANIDSLFDRHLLTFDADGTAMLSVSLARSEVDKIGVVNCLAEAPRGRRASFLERHRDNFRRRETLRVERAKLRESSEA